VLPLSDTNTNQNTKMKNITTHADLIELFNEDTTRDLHLHMERDCGTHSVAFYISTEDEKVAEGVMDTETNEDAEYTDELAWAVLDDCYDGFVTVTEYDSLVAGTNPGTVRA
jgi:hypothetical protein